MTLNKQYINKGRSNDEIISFSYFAVAITPAISVYSSMLTCYTTKISIGNENILPETYFELRMKPDKKPTDRLNQSLDSKTSTPSKATD